MNIGNLFTAAEPPAQGERFEELLSCRNLRIERIVSSSSIDSSEYDQEQDEWVALLRGEATLDIAGERVELRAGDHEGTPTRAIEHVMGATQYWAYQIYFVARQEMEHLGIATNLLAAIGQRPHFEHGSYPDSNTG